MKLNYKAVQHLADYFDEEISIGKLAEYLGCSQEDALIVVNQLELKEMEKPGEA